MLCTWRELESSYWKGKGQAEADTSGPEPATASLTSPAATQLRIVMPQVFTERSPFNQPLAFLQSDAGSDSSRFRRSMQGCRACDYLHMCLITDAVIAMCRQRAWHSL